MRRLVQAMFNDPTPPEILRALKDRGYDGVRIDAQQCDAPKAADLTTLALDCGLWPLVIVRDVEQMQALPAGTHVEVRNEPDIGTNQALTPAQYLAIVSRCVDLGAQRGLPVWIGAVSNLNRRGLDFLHAVFSVRWPDDVGCSVHRYANGGYDEGVMVPQDGFRLRDDEVAALKRIIGARPYGISETGFSLQPRCQGAWFWRRCRAWTEPQQAQNLLDDYHYWLAWKAEFWTVFQIASDATHSYGLRRPDGTWRPSAEIFVGDVR